jgi:hypothetical protein
MTHDENGRKAETPEMRGRLFEETQKRDPERSPDYRGWVRVNGTRFRVGGWLRVTERGRYLALRLRLPQEPQQVPHGRNGGCDSDF